MLLSKAIHKENTGSFLGASIIAEGHSQVAANIGDQTQYLSAVSWAALPFLTILRRMIKWITTRHLEKHKSDEKQYNNLMCAIKAA